MHTQTDPYYTVCSTVQTAVADCAQAAEKHFHRAVSVPTTDKLTDSVVK